MILVVLVTVVLGATLLWALYSEPIVALPTPRPRRLSVPVGAADIRRHDAPIVIAGYDRKWIDAHLGQVAAIYAHMQQIDPWTTAGPASPTTGDLRTAAALSRRSHGSGPPDSVLDV